MNNDKTELVILYDDLCKLLSKASDIENKHQWINDDKLYSYYIDIYESILIFKDHLGNRIEGIKDGQ